MNRTDYKYAMQGYYRCHKIPPKDYPYKGKYCKVPLHKRPEQCTECPYNE